MCTSESKINKKFTITTQDRIASHRISHLSSTRVPSSFKIFLSLIFFGEGKAFDQKNDFCKQFHRTRRIYGCVSSSYVFNKEKEKIC
jgi:hypothetical protein